MDFLNIIIIMTSSLSHDTGYIELVIIAIMAPLPTELAIPWISQMTIINVIIIKKSL